MYEVYSNSELHNNPLFAAPFPGGKENLDPIMRGSNDRLCIFGFDFQLCISDIIVLDTVLWGIELNGLVVIE